MAQIIRRTTVDDITGEEGATTHSFSLDGQAFEIDLVSVDELRAALRPFMEAGRKAAKGKRSSASSPEPTSIASNPTEIRRWARQNGLTAPDRGRIPQVLREAFEAKDPALATEYAAQ